MAAKGAPKLGKTATKKPASKPTPEATPEPASASPAPKRKKATPIHWREDEIDLVVNEVVRIAIEIGEPVPFEYGRFSKLLGKAQNAVLPEGRRRSLQVMAAFKRVEERILLKHPVALARKAREDAEAASPPANPPAPVESPVLAQREEPRDALAVMAADALVSAVVGSPFYRALVDSLANRVKTDLAARFAEFGSPKGQPAATDKPAANDPPRAKPKVVVVGLLDRQAARIREDFGGLFDLRFIASDQAPRGGVYAQCKDALAVIVMTRFISHEHDRQAQSHSDNVVRLNGGITDLERFLKEAA